MKAFLDSRKVGYDKQWGSSESGRSLTRSYSDPSGPPPIVEELSSDASVELVEETVISHLATVSRIMAIEITPMEEEIVSTEQRIKLFLRFVNSYDQTLCWQGRKRMEKEAFIIRKYNYISLLNIPGTLRRYGSLWSLYEGGGLDEGSIRLLKKHINGTNSNWAYNGALLYLKEKSITCAVQDLTESMMKDKTTTEMAAPVQSMLCYE
jgi:hypothetical protein